MYKDIANELLQRIRSVRDEIYTTATVGVLDESTQTWVLDNNEYRTQYVTVTLRDNTIVKANVNGKLPIAGAVVQLEYKNNTYFISSEEIVAGKTSQSKSTLDIGLHSHNKGHALFQVIDPANVADGGFDVVPFDSKIQLQNKYYYDLDGTLQVYANKDKLTFLDSLTDNATNERWVIVYIDRSDGSINKYNATEVTGSVSTTNDLITAVNECITDEPIAYPYLAVRVGSGLPRWKGYTPPVGYDFSGCDFIRFEYIPVNTISELSDLTDVDISSIDNNDIILYNGSVFVNDDVINAFNSQIANTVLAAPDGTDGAPTFRTLTDEDIPDALTINGGSINNTSIGNTTPLAVTTNNLFVTSDSNTYSVRFRKNGKNRAIMGVDINDAIPSISFTFRSWDASGNSFLSPLTLNPITGVSTFRGVEAAFESMYLALRNTSKPPAKSGHALLYTNGGELFTKDDAGNETQLSSHLLTNDTTSDYYISELSSRTGYLNTIDIIRALRWLEDFSGETFIHSERKQVGKSELRNVYNRRYASRTQKYLEWKYKDM